MIRSVAFDMDQVLADFASGVYKLLGQRVPDSYPWEFVPDWVWGKLSRSFWRELTPLAHGMRLFREATKRGLDVFLVTSPPRDNRGAAVDGKTDWVRHWLPDLSPDAILFVTQKYRLSRPDTLLIDDKEENVVSWRAKGGPAILYPAPYNSARDTNPETLTLEIPDVPKAPSDAVCHRCGHAWCWCG